MQKAKELVSKLLERYEGLIVKNKPVLTCKLGLPQEGIRVENAGSAICLTANHERNLCFGLNQLMVALRSGHRGEYTGLMEPRYPMRLRKGGGQDAEQLCRFGYNGVIVDRGVDVGMYRAYGLKVFERQALSKSPLDDEFGLLETEADGVFWESGLLTPEFLEHPKGSDYTLGEMVFREMERVERSKRPLIYYLPAVEVKRAERHNLWMPELMERAGKRTTIAFPATIGELLHPFWHELRRSECTYYTPLLPLVEMDKGPVFARMERHAFAGMAGTGGDEATLWVAGGALWHGKDPYLLQETWDRAG